MKRKITAGLTSQTIAIFVNDTTSTTGAGLAGLTSATGGLVAEYRRQGESAWTAFALTAGTLGTWSDRGFVADGALAGAYELGLPNAAIAGGAAWVIVRLRGAANMLAVQCEIELDAFPYNANPFSGMTSLANWLRLIARKGFTDATALGEINTGGTGALDPTAESIEALANAVGTPAQAATVAAAIAELGSPAQASIFTGLTSLANWLRLIARKGFTDATALGEINTGGTGALDPTAESIEALAAAIAGVGGGGGGTDPLANTVPGTYPPGSAGAALGRIGIATINIASPIAANGDLELIAADDYFAADGRALDFSNPAGTWPNLTGASVALVATKNGAEVIGPIEGNVATPTGAQRIVFEPTALDLPMPATSAAAVEYTYGIVANLANGHRATLKTGRLRLVRAH